MSFGSMVRAHREKRGLRLGEFARRAGFKVSYASEIELSKKKPPVEAVVRRMIQGLELTKEQAEELLRQAEIERRSFKFELMDRSRPEQEMMSALGRAWDERTLTHEQMDEIVKLLNT